MTLARLAVDAVDTDLFIPLLLLLPPLPDPWPRKSPPLTLRRRLARASASSDVKVPLFVPFLPPCGVPDEVEDCRRCRGDARTEERGADADTWTGETEVPALGKGTGSPEDGDMLLICPVWAP